MQFFSLVARTVSISTIAVFGVLGCSQANQPITRQDNSVYAAQTVSADDAADRVDDVLDDHPSLKQFDVDAEDEGNAIVLTGRVREASQRQLAEEVAKQAAPGFTIINRINVR